jgi:hypothetical protein
LLPSSTTMDSSDVEVRVSKAEIEIKGAHLLLYTKCTQQPHTASHSHILTVLFGMLSLVCE